jgi:hypothetical protein
MTFQNRVDPWGRIFRTPARGSFMGNRGGALHNEQQEIVRQYNGQRWITCVLEFKGRYRKVMTPRRYTELFFLDEAVAFAAGHRPCAECRRSRFNAFVEAWKHRDAEAPGRIVRATEIDAELHRARIDGAKSKVTYEASMDSLPNGCFVEISGGAHLVWDDALFLWAPEQYVKRQRRPAGLTVTVLTPVPTVECFRAGYAPQVHGSCLTTLA